MNVGDYILLWNHATIRVVDIRHMVMEADDQLDSYRLPANAFLFTVRGHAQIWMDGTVSVVQGYTLLHGGKGSCLKVTAGDLLEYYLLFYKATLPKLVDADTRLLLTQEQMLSQPYCFIPLYPVNLLDKMRAMYEEWRREDALEKLHVKSLFYQFVYELMWQLEKQGVEPNSPNLSEQVIRYMNEHFHEPIMLETMAKLLNYSPQYLSRKFKEQMGKSPIDYLIRLRMEKAQELLLTTDAGMLEIATKVGYPDLFYFNRIFKKVVGVAPGSFKGSKAGGKHIPHRAKMAIKSSIVGKHVQRYSDDENHYHYKTGGNFTMYRRSSLSIAASLLLCFMLLLSACTSGGTHTNSSNGNTVSSTNTQSASENAARTVDHQKDSAHQNAATKTVSTIFGDVEIPVQAKRIVAIDYLGSMIALGVKPVGSSEWLMQNPYLKNKITGVEDIGESIEKLMDLEPDLILTLTNKADQYEKYSRVAPTVSIPSDRFSSIHEEITFFGQLLGREDEATAWLEEYDAKIAAAKEKVNKALPKETTISVLEDQEKTIYAFGRISGRGGRALYEALGLPAPEKVAKELTRTKFYPISKEVLGDYTGDYIVLTTSFKKLEDYQTDPVWGKLEVVKTGRVYIWGEETSWFQDPIAVLSQAEMFAEWLVEQSKL